MLERMAAALVAAVVAMGAARAEEPVVLKFNFMPPPFSPYVAQSIGPWMDGVKEKSGGAVEAKLFPGGQLANYNNVLDRITNGVVEVSYGIFGNLGNQFPKASVSVLPFEAEDSETPSVALWRLYQRGLVSDGLDIVRPLALFVFPYSALHAAKPIHTLDDMKGQKIGIFSRQLGDIVELLGGTGVSLQPTEIYQSVSRGLIVGTLFGWAGVPTFKLQEVAPQHLDAPLGNSPGFIIMNKDAYAKLPAKGKAAVDAESYEKFSRSFGNSGDRQAEAARAKIRETVGQSIYRLAPAEEAKWRDRLKPIAEEWVRSTPNGAAILAADREELAKLRASK
jgi:TRAP-type C4-dicarboxylate transport system substrate-binding protein